MRAVAYFDERVEGSALVWIAADSAESDALPTTLAEEHDHHVHGCSNKDSGLRS